MSDIVTVVKHLIGNFFGTKYFSLPGGSVLEREKYYDYENEELTQEGRNLLGQILANLDKEVITLDYELIQNFEGLCNIYTSLGYKLKSSVMEIYKNNTFCSGILVRSRDGE